MIDARPYPVPDWSAVAERVMPAVVMVSVVPRPMGDGSANRAWLIPGVQQNAATAALSDIRAVANGWAEHDQKRAWETRGAGVLVGDGRHALTAAHVLADTESVRVKLAGGQVALIYPRVQGQVDGDRKSVIEAGALWEDNTAVQNSRSLADGPLI